mgnify:CR=1 FL=1
MADTLTRTYKLGSTGDLSSATTVLTAGSGATITILSVALCNAANDDETFDMWVVPASTSDLIYHYKDQSIPSKATFIHNDKIIMLTGDVLRFQTASASDIDIYISHLTQT